MKMSRKTARRKNFDTNFRSGLEAKLGKVLDPSFEYEPFKLPYIIPARSTNYTPDFVRGNVIIEGKGWFRNSAERDKYLHIRDANPEYRFIFVLSNTTTKSYSRSKMLLTDWLEKNGFEWYLVDTLPEEFKK